MIIKRSKYGSSKVLYEDIKFDSKLECNAYKYFKENNITILELQPRYLLQDSFKHNGKSYRKIEYVADFKIELNGEEIVIDMKGMRTDVYAMKEKMLLYKYRDIKFYCIKSIKELRLFIEGV